MMDATRFHAQYNDLLSAFRRQLPDPGLRVAVARDADPFLRQCALAVWKADGSPVTPAHGELYHAMGGGGVLFWEMVSRMEQANTIPEAPFWQKMKAYDQQTGRSVSRRFLQTLSLLLVLLAAADDTVGPQEAEAIQAYLDELTRQCNAENLPGDRTPVSVRQYITTVSPAPETPAQPKPAEPEPAPAASESAAEEPQPTLEELLKELDDLCGLEKVKADVHSLINLVKVRKLREDAGLPVPPMSLHMVFQGNPGTGKTTVARLLAQIYRAIGVLSQGQLVEVDRSGLVAGYVGQTALKTAEVIQKALGGVLFIDEAYALAPQDKANDFGQEAIEVILKNMEDHRKDFIVIVAGYTDLMNHFLHSNPGLESRFNKYLTFDDYDGGQLLQIFRSLCKKSGYTPSPEADQLAEEGFRNLYDNRDENFGNARDVRNVFEHAVAKQADRLAAMNAPTREDLMALLPEDFAF